jgi:hypothetical protein
MFGFFVLESPCGITLVPGRRPHSREGGVADPPAEPRSTEVPECSLLTSLLPKNRIDRLRAGAGFG